MNWNKVAGQEKLKKQLIDAISENRVSHAQLFLGKEGYGVLPLALAFAEEILRQENPHAASKVTHLNHLDLHFSFPVYSEKSKSLSNRFFNQFREMVLQNPYSDLEDWSNFLESENKQLFISADEIDDQNKKFSLKSFEGGTKILIIWRADRMNIQASNKLLKFLEEPPEKTLIILTAENTDAFLPTILSRTQIVEVPRLEDSEVEHYLTSGTNEAIANLKELVYQSQGNINDALKLMRHDEVAEEFESLFVKWVRDAFQVKKKPFFLKEIIKWAKTIASWNREKQKQFLDYCGEMFRLALLQNYGNANLVYKKIDASGFNWDSFSRFIHGANIESILEEINTANLHLLRNGNSKIIWTDLGIKLSRYIHKQP